MHQGEYYHSIVKETVKKFPNHAIVEIGTDGGTTAFWAMKAMHNSESWFFTIDPYGDKPYKTGEQVAKNLGYNDKNYRRTIAQLYRYALEHDINYLHWKLTSQDWMKIWDKVEFWNDQNKDIKFSLAYLDGDHAWDPVQEEFDFFYERIPVGGYIVIDDFDLLGGEAEVKKRIKQKGKWFFNYDDNHHRCYFQK